MAKKKQPTINSFIIFTFLPLAFIIFIYFTLNGRLLLKNPLIWPDEAEFADIALNILNEGKIYGRLHYEEFLALGSKVYYSPLIFFLLALVFKFFGFSIVTQRLTALFFGWLSLMVFWLLAKKLLFKPSSKKPPQDYKSYQCLLWPLLLFLSDWHFNQASRMARPEIFTLLFFLAACWMILKENSLRALLLAGLFSAIAFLFHFSGVMSFLIIGFYLILKSKKRALKNLILFSLPVILLILLWALLVNCQFKTLFESFKLAGLRKSLDPGFFSHLTFSKIFFILSSLYVVSYLLFKNSQKIFLIPALLITWLWVIATKQPWYFVYPLPFLYLGYGLIINQEKGAWKHLTYLLIGLTLALNSQSFYKVFKQPTKSYWQYAQSIANKIPNNQQVLLSSIPDPYFVLKNNPTLELRLYVPIPGLKDCYLDKLNSSDYIVFTETLDQVYGQLLPQYIKNNTEETILIGNGPNEYSGQVIKLKPLEQRIVKGY